MLQSVEPCPLSERIARPAIQPEAQHTPPTMEEIDAATQDVRRTIERIDALMLSAYLGRIRVLARTLPETLAKVGYSLDPEAPYSPLHPWHGSFGLRMLVDDIRDAYLQAREADLLARVCRHRMARPLTQRIRRLGDLPEDLEREAGAVHAEWEYWESHPLEWDIPDVPPGDRYAGEAAREE